MGSGVVSFSLRWSDSSTVVCNGKNCLVTVGSTYQFVRLTVFKFWRSFWIAKKWKTVELNRRPFLFELVTKFFLPSILLFLLNVLYCRLFNVKETHLNEKRSHPLKSVQDGNGLHSVPMYFVVRGVTWVRGKTLLRLFCRSKVSSHPHS